MIHSTNNGKYFFEIYKDEDNFFYFQLKNKEDKILLKSSSFTQKTNCQKGVKSVIRNSKNEFRFEVEQETNEDWFFRLKAGNGKIIANSRKFVTKEELKNFSEDLKSLSLKPPVIDNTKLKKLNHDVPK